MRLIEFVRGLFEAECKTCGDEGCKDPHWDVKAWDAQHDLIKKRFGKETADKANYGWGTTDRDTATKVYHKSGAKVLSTSWDEKGNMSHEWSDY